jgi:hypothetical protein
MEEAAKDGIGRARATYNKLLEWSAVIWDSISG